MGFLISIYERWTEIPRWQRWLVIISAIFVLFLVIYFLRIVPLNEQLLVERERLESLRQTVNKLRVVRIKKEKLEKEIGNLEKELSSVERKLPSGKEEVNRIICSISKANSRVTVVSLKRGSPVDREYYVEVPYSIELKTTYPEFVHWCERLFRSNRIVSFDRLSIRADRTGNYTISVNLQVKVFNLKR